MLAVAQVSLLVWDQMRVVHASREGARVLAVTNDAGRAKEAALHAGSLEGSRTGVEVAPDSRPAATDARVTVRYRPTVLVPFVGRFAPAITLVATTWMRMERDGP